MPSAWTGISFRSLRVEESLWTPQSSWVFSGLIIYLFVPAGLAPLPSWAALGSRSVDPASSAVLLCLPHFASNQIPGVDIEIS